MFAVYVFAALVGWPFVLFFVFFGGDADADVDVDLDVDAGLGGHGWDVSDFLSVRAAVFFLAFFGLTGIVLDLLNANGIVTLLFAIVVAVFGVLFNGVVYRYLRRSSSNSRLRTSDVRGATGEVIVAIADDSKGRIVVQYGGHRLRYTARPFKQGSGREYQIGDRVTVIDVSDGTALVTAMESLEA